MDAKAMRTKRAMGAMFLSTFMMAKGVPDEEREKKIRDQI
jgi:hypothetical protein